MSCSGTCNYASNSVGSIDYAVSAPISDNYNRISTLEAAVQHESPSPSMLESAAQGNETKIGNQTYAFNQVNYSNGYSLPSKMDYFTPAPFLKSDRPAARFIGKAEDIQDYIAEAFEAVTGKQLPEDIAIRVVSHEKLEQMHTELGGVWNNGIQGFTLNKKGFGQSLIVVKENDMDAMMVTVGHEIGHALTLPLKTKIDEEAKAFAFEMAWIKAIKENNIAGLSDSFNLNPGMPAKNGVHNIAFSFVVESMQNGEQAIDIFNALNKHDVEVQNAEY